MNQFISKLSAIPAQITDTALQAAGKPQPANEWSLRTIAIHLSVVDLEIWQVRLKLMAEQDNPKWQWTEPDLAAWEKRFEAKSLDDLLAEFARTRQGIVHHLKSLTEQGWARIGTHRTFGQMDVAGLCARILEHDEEHLEELKRRSAFT